MQKWFVVLIAVLAFMGLMSAGKKDGVEEAEPQAAAVIAASPSSAALSEAVRKSLPGNAKWNALDVESDNRGYRLNLKYKADPKSHREVERDTKLVAQAALNALVAAGRNPHQERMFLSVWAKKDERGATGASLVRMYGRAIYNFNNDSIEYKPYE